MTRTGDGSGHGNCPIGLGTLLLLETRKKRKEVSRKSTGRYGYTAKDPDNVEIIGSKCILCKGQEETTDIRSASFLTYHH